VTVADGMAVFVGSSVGMDVGAGVELGNGVGVAAVVLCNVHAVMMSGINMKVNEWRLELCAFIFVPCSGIV
jgi:hypothetical protein